MLTGCLCLCLFVCLLPLLCSLVLFVYLILHMFTSCKTDRRIHADGLLLLVLVFLFCFFATSVVFACFVCLFDFAFFYKL